MVDAGTAHVPLDSVFSRDCQTLLGLSILYWDWLVTLDQEVKIIWPNVFPSWSASALSYVLLRYSTMLAYLPVLVLEIITPLEGRPCGPYMLFRQILFVYCHGFVYILLSIRVYALYERKKKILVFLWALAAAVGGVGIYGIIIGMSPGHTFSKHCLTQADPKSVAKKALAWEGLLVGDFALFSLTVWRSYKLNHEARLRGGIPILNLILRDGTLYFCVLLICNALNIATFYFNAGKPGLLGSLGTLSSCMSVTMMGRMTLNLQREGSPRFRGCYKAPHAVRQA
ncbi:hypothetical protein DL96DRAFT_1114676 [Flagelloscypha sp. PMI_526]|nr:hypothetical protein DL96DRAFT_1114676 [Flagelloscypha sp. PMI_526]